MPDPAHSARPLELHIWRHIAVCLPADWEMLQFSSEYERGRIAFADRYQFRAELSWRAVKGEPDYERMVSDYMLKLEQENKLGDAKPLRKAGWHGFVGMMQKDYTSRFGRYLEEVGCLIELVLLWPDQQRDAELETEILSSIEHSPPDEYGFRRWRAFGLDVKVPPTAVFEGCTAQPARAEFAFSDPKTGNQWQFMRLGMVNSWFDGNLEHWLKKSLGRNIIEPRFTHRTRGNHELITAEGRYKPQTIHLRNGTFQAAAWIDDKDGRLYCAKVWQRKKLPGAECRANEMIS